LSSGSKTQVNVCVFDMKNMSMYGHSRLHKVIHKYW